MKKIEQIEAVDVKEIVGLWCVEVPAKPKAKTWLLLLETERGFEYALGRYRWPTDYRSELMQATTLERAIADVEYAAAETMGEATRRGLVPRRTRVDIRSSDPAVIARKIELAGLHFEGLCSCRRSSCRRSSCRRSS